MPSAHSTPHFTPDTAQLTYHTSYCTLTIAHYTMLSKVLNRYLDTYRKQSSPSPTRYMAVYCTLFVVSVDFTQPLKQIKV